MATLHRNVFIHTTTDPTLSTLIDTRCYLIRLPAGVTLPAISYYSLSDDDFDFRAHGEGTNRTITRVSFDCWAETADEAVELADALTVAWSGYRLPPDIGWAQIVLRLDAYEESLNRYRSTVDVRVEHSR